MIAFKWVIKEGDKYYPILNYGINPWLPDITLDYYELNKTYSDSKDASPHRDKDFHIYRLQHKNSFELPGYHFWKKSINDKFDMWNKCIQSKKFPEINAIISCEIFDIIKEDDERLICKSFTVIGVLNLTKGGVNETKVGICK
jgi:hypothetical protein